MAKITYKLSAFNAKKASQGSLVVMVDKNLTINEDSHITNVTIVGGAEVRTDDFYGAGICRIVGQGTYCFTVNSTTYNFTSDGRALGTESINYKLVMGTVVTSLSTVGNSVNTPSTGHTTRSIDGEGNKKDTTEVVEGGQAVVNNLNARDTFALQALHGLFNNMKEKDPASLSDSEMNFYCQQAYQWAANMMLVAASSRASFKDDTAVPTTNPEDVGDLTSNTEKLLNNLIVALETMTTELNTKLSSIKSSIDNQITAINSVAAAIENLQPSSNT